MRHKRHLRPARSGIGPALLPAVIAIGLLLVLAGFIAPPVQAGDASSAVDVSPTVDVPPASIDTPLTVPGAGAPIAVEGGILFTFSKPSARTVHLAGEFNGWDPAALPMLDEDGDGVWEVVLDLQTGRTFQYKFVTDGGVSWEPDPHNPERTDDGHGAYNSVLSLGADGTVVAGVLGGATTHEPIVETLESLGRPLSLAIIWHQHQPKYLKDLETGEYMEPWVRLHAIKDYYDMVAILDDYPDIHFTVNLTPILLMQLEDLLESLDVGRPCDAYYRMTLKDAGELTEDDQVYLLTHFFNANWDNMIHVWQRYKELKGMKGGDSPEELLAAARMFGEQDWRDLQMWFNLAWFDPDFQDGDVELEDGRTVTVKHLIEKERGFAESDKIEMLAAQRAIMENIVSVHRRLQDRGQIEVTTTPFYHPILPLIHDTELARVAMPGAALPSRRFARRDDVKRHLDLAVEYYEKRFGIAPAGLWPAEGSVSQEIVPAVANAGILWMASDDQVLQWTLGARSLAAPQRYTMYWAGAEGARVAMIFRDHRLSDDIGFNFGRMDGVEAANSMMRSLHSIHRQLAAADEDHIVPIILDGENAWEWFQNDGKKFFHSWYAQMEQAEWLRTVTVAEYLADNPPVVTLPKLWAGSWISHDFSTWIGEPEENRAWEYLSMVRDHLEVRERSGEVDRPTLARAYDEMLAAEGSDWFWWYGDDQNSSLDGAFDEIFRGTLAHVYEIMGDELPAFLSVPIVTTSGGAGGGAMARADGADDATLLAGPVYVGDGVLFSIRENTAGTIHLAGAFNAWSTDATPMADDDGDGIWTVVIELEPGSYEYKFVIDGGAQWVADSGNSESVPDPYGGQNSLVVVE
ncbi:hypothetical protein K8S17_07210 [bacterium]|nr:hypothetical protein [bacterium]